ncbi:hypothetical protein RCL_jg1118.t1 [Rhizophagus clarus]|uniref:Uncharacterized protein n=1 Tax=Rhizophagus clarus TaxID=94130 RepID=A0A8H3M6Z8_9GLOM|nr:hypothetical protein RCL_jg1118.t1 [Rhizophagus clarus]
MSDKNMLCKCAFCLKEDANGVWLNQNTFNRHRLKMQEYLAKDENLDVTSQQIEGDIIQYTGEENMNLYAEEDTNLYAEEKCYFNEDDNELYSDYNDDDNEENNDDDNRENYDDINEKNDDDNNKRG